MPENAPRDENRTPVIVAVSSTDPNEIVFVKANIAAGAARVAKETEINAISIT